MKLDLIAATAFGIEAVCKREIVSLGYEIQKVEDGKITFKGDERAIVKTNLHLRTADRILLKIDEFTAKDFETLFQRVKGYEWEKLIPVEGKFTVTCSTVKSRLSSEPACQATVKKAIAERLSDFYSLERLPETGDPYTVKVRLLKDRATITVDTTGPSLHKRGYRVKTVEAPIKENMAAALVLLSFWNKDRILIDPFCGSGTIAIEAAMAGLNIAPGINRKFACDNWDIISGKIWKEEKRAAFNQIEYNRELKIHAGDIDKKAVEAARENSIEAGVDHVIEFKNMSVSEMKPRGEGGIILTNPPYGERIGKQEDIEKIYAFLKDFLKDNPHWSLFLITGRNTAVEDLMGKKADRRRKLYNGRLETCYYQFHGKKLKS